MATLRIENLSRRFGSVLALSDLTLTLPSGAYTVVVGPSGSGKTTLLRLLAGLDRPDAGRIRIADRVLDGAGAPGVAWVPQSGALLPHLDICRNLALPLELRGMPATQRLSRVREIARDLGIAHLLDRRPDTLSAGERQRVSIGRALASDPQVLLLDEPMASLDPHLRRQLRGDLRRSLGPDRRTVVHVTHDPDEALALADLLLVLRDGRAEQFDTPATVYAHPASAFVAGFIGTLPMNLVAGTADPATGAFRPVSGTWTPGRPPGPLLPAGPVTLGIHPEHLAPQPGPAPVDVRLSGRVVHHEFAGHESHLTLDTGGVTWRIRWPHPGIPDRVEIGFRWSDCRWFHGPAGTAWPPPTPGTIEPDKKHPV